MDYAFAPGATRYDRVVKKIFEYEPSIEFVDNEAAAGSAIEAFVLTLITWQSSFPDQFPPNTIYLGSHGSSSGTLKVTVDRFHNSANAGYEAFDTADTNDTITVPSDVVMGGGIFVTSSLTIKGCNVGKARPFLQKIKDALGGNIPFIVAPKHFHFVYGELTQRGVFEGMMYEYAIQQKDRHGSRTEIIDAFKAAGFTDIDGTAVPDDQWQHWVPRRSRRRGEQVMSMYVQLGETAAGVTRLNVGHRYRNERIRIPINIPAVASRPSNAESRAMLQSFLSGLPAFQEAHPFPYYERLGLADLNAFMNEIDWNFSWNRRELSLACIGTYYKVTALIPITDPTTDNLIFNFHPKPGTSYTKVENMLDNDSRLFATV